MTVTRYSITFLALTVLIILLVAGCVQVISRDVLKEVDKRVAFAELIQDPSAYTGRVVLLGGVIVETVNKQEGTLLEVYQTRLDSEGRPTQTDRSEGRFLAFYKGYLDAAIYQTGREVTIAGIVEGERVKPLGEMEYRYPSILIKEIHLWKEEDSFQYQPYPWDYWDPWWRRTWWHPWHGHHRH